MATLQNLLVVAKSTVSGSTCTADINGVDTVIQVARGLVVAVGDVLTVSRYGSTWVANSRLYAVSPVVIDPVNQAPPTKPTTVTGRTSFSPFETRSYRSSGWRTETTDVYHGQYGGWGNHTGCAFYKRAPRSLDGATVTRATVKARRPSGTGGSYAAGATKLWLISNSVRPAGAPTIIGSDTSGPNIGAGQTATVTIPDSFGQALVDGTAGGLALFDSDGSPYTIFAGKGTWSPAFTLTLDWYR